MTGSMRTGLFLCIMTFGAGTLQADVLNLSDGSRIVGTIEEIDATEAKLSGTFAGDLTVPRDTIASVETAEPVTVQLTSDAYITGRMEVAEGQRIIVHVDEAGPRPVRLADIRGVYRDDPLTLQRRELAVEVTGNATAGATVTGGNTDSENLLIDSRIVTRTQRNRYTLAGEYTEEESEGVQVKETWTGLVKYDHFVSERWFWFNSATFESDRFADLKLRSALAAGMGYQFFESDERSLSIEGGPSYIDENFDEAPDDSFFGSRWAINYDQRILDGVFFYLYNESLLGLEDTDDLTVRTRTGFRMNLTDRIIARFQTAVGWDRSPPADTDSTDYEHTLSVGYTF